LILAELTAHLMPDGPTQRAEPTSRIRQANDANLGIGTLKHDCVRSKRNRILAIVCA